MKGQHIMREVVDDPLYKEEFSGRVLHLQLGILVSSSICQYGLVEVT